MKAGPADGGAERAAVLARWNDLTRHILPARSASERWPIRLDHCFMRVLLDAAVGERWDRQVRRPAVRHAGLPVLLRAVELGEAVLADPDLLPRLNRASLAMRGHGA